MKASLFILLFIPVFTCGQKILVLENSGRGRTKMYSPHEHISLRTSSSNARIEGKIHEINDSSLIIHFGTEIMVDDVAAIYRKRWGFNLLQKISLAAGLLYISISTLNGAINGDDPVVPQETLVISGSLVAAGILLTPLTTRTYRINNTKWKVKILDFTAP